MKNTGKGILDDRAAKGDYSMEISSAAFEDESTIPRRYACNGENISPPLSWSEAPADTVSFALIVDDPDAPMGTYVHWVLYDLPADTTALQERIPTEKILSNGAKQGFNSSRKIGYTGPCPPSGTHRYYFKLYALNAAVGAEPGLTKEQLLEKIEDHILAQAQVMGTYSHL